MAISPVYPRWRGEHRVDIRSAGNKRGLSPLARGTLLLQIINEAQARFIPAGAGNTRIKRPVAIPRPVYPRWRGEHVNFNSFYGDLDGLSPLARGTH